VVPGGLGTSLLHAAPQSFSVSIFVHVRLRSAFTILANGGVEWRGTWYPPEQLKENVL
jgi:hypothetical protein